MLTENQIKKAQTLGKKDAQTAFTEGWPVKDENIKSSAYQYLDGQRLGRSIPFEKWKDFAECYASAYREKRAQLVQEKAN